MSENSSVQRLPNRILAWASPMVASLYQNRTETVVNSDNPFQSDPYLHALLYASEDESWIKVHFNGVMMWLPTGTLITMAHCVRLVEGQIEVNVETAHLNWMRSRLVPGSTFLDVGAATGAITLPIVAEHPGVQIVAFEPADRARRLLTATLIKNNFSGVKIINAAVSDKNGSVTFADRPVSDDGSCPFLPETSTILRPGETDPHGRVIEVETVSLDNIAEVYGLTNRNIVIKIDIEGYEIEALNGAGALLNNNNVCLAIDIHKIPGQEITTESECRRLLDSYGYKCSDMVGHVLLAEKA
jgi:FkbM family methyltransferase